MTHWTTALRDLTRAGTGGRADGYRLANVAATEAALNGAGPHGGGVRPALGRKAVVNIAARHALAFLDLQSGRPGRGVYLNRPAVARILGTALAGPTIRDRVDAVLEGVATAMGLRLRARDMHFAALELNGTGIAYFGDICLVLRDDAVPARTLVLIRNSYDMTVPPVFGKVHVRGSWLLTRDAAIAAVRTWAGLWGADAVGMAVVKVLTGAERRERRITTGQISDRLLVDEDYIEIVAGQGFTPRKVQEIRLSAADAAREAQIGDRIRRGPPPGAAEFLWRARRRAVWRDAARAGIPCRVVTTTGRSRA